jgi:hypothetical protein
MYKATELINFFLGLAIILFMPECLRAQSVLDLYAANKTVTYQECHDFYKQLKSDKIRVSAINLTHQLSDAGNPIFLYKFSAVSDTEKKEKVRLLINNNIHPGEPAGVDACMKLVHQLNEGIFPASVLEKVDLYIIPAYNVDGMNQRNSHSRANQNGPEAYGFRPNATNYDLNRDMVKGDARNTFFLREVFNWVNPHLFIDTHISDGADYTYTMTLISTLTQQLPQRMQAMMTDTLLPEIYGRMKGRGDEICPYVDTRKSTPDSGLVAFNDLARFTTGYAALHNCWGFVSESHMLKPYPEQVESTLRLLKEFLEMAGVHASGLMATKRQAEAEVSAQQLFHLAWEPDYGRADTLWFKGYEAGYRKSEVTGLPVLYYDRQKPYIKAIPYYKHYNSLLTYASPGYFIIGQAWHKVIEQLQSSGVLMHRINRPVSDLSVTAKYFRKVEYSKNPYEGHFIHRSVVTDTVMMRLSPSVGDYVIPMNQPLNAFIMQVLIPEAPDSYFRWNYFDPVLQQKEWFSDYVFDPTALQLLKQQPTLKAELEAYVKENKLENNAWEQLLFLYRHSDYYESSHLRYPVFSTQEIILPYTDQKVGK